MATWQKPSYLVKELINASMSGGLSLGPLHFVERRIRLFVVFYWGRVLKGKSQSGCQAGCEANCSFALFYQSP